MSNTVGQVIRETYSNAPTDVVIYHTLELYHPSFVNFEGNLGALRIVNEETEVLARLEDGAPRDAGLLVRFYPYAFKIALPTMSGNLMVKFNIILDNVVPIIPNLNTTVYENNPIEVIYRKYFSNGLGTPLTANPLTLSITEIVTNNTSAKLSVAYKDFHNKKFPGIYYKNNSFPFLKV